MNINTNKYKWFITNKEDNVTATPIAVCGLLSEKTDELENAVSIEKKGAKAKKYAKEIFIWFSLSRCRKREPEVFIWL